MAATRAMISGRPKAAPGAVEEKTTATTPTLILKAAGDDYPHLPVNEYLCMSAAKRAGIQDVDRVLLLRVSEDVSEVPRPLAIALIVIHTNPMFANIVRPIKATLFCLDQGIHARRIGAGNTHADAPHNSIWQSIPFEVLPSCATIDGFI